jgi:hypothetical protein
VRHGLVAVVFAAVALGFVSASQADRPPARAAAACAGERWPVKTMSDRRASMVRLSPRRKTVGGLRSLTKPRHHTTRKKGVETHVYRVRARLIEFKQEGDFDIHLVISEPKHPNRTMIVELPDPSCLGSTLASVGPLMAQANADVRTACGNPPRTGFRQLSGMATITGVGFFDGVHGQPGVARNGIELHPVLNFKTSGCTPGGLVFPREPKQE